jgi:hypothetical protein
MNAAGRFIAFVIYAKRYATAAGIILKRVGSI